MGEHIVPSATTLVKYGVPEIVSANEKITPLKKVVNKDTDDALNCILPPKEWEENGVLWRQKVSSEPVTRNEVIKLGEQLDLLLEVNKARALGICPVRRELFTQCFDELVRQVTLNCVEQGILLLRIRDEMRLTCRTYQSLYESAIASCLRKNLKTEKDFDDRTEDIKAMNDINQQLQEKIEQLESKIKQIQRRNTEILLAEQKQYDGQIQFLKKTNHQLKVQLEGIINPKK